MPAVGWLWPSADDDDDEDEEDENVGAMMIIEMMLMCSFQLWVHLGHRKEAVQLHKGANLQGQVGCLLRKTRK